jgi:hypothetical protein
VGGASNGRFASAYEALDIGQVANLNEQPKPNEGENFPCRLSCDNQEHNY